ncbi:odorant receptor 67d-like [Toxorhynchites rutilus septentrionalis]|uniref:odorant receptor 67d-like n=1 Tax=Toxorhynchites rutilus septentrionalis TaxID=329112 RepID=UPI002478581E|nr:odorant receptor 67d-like [Toxorhynchites rutilus septentrionalis]
MRHDSTAKLDKSVSVVHRLASSIGYDVLDPNFRMNKRSYCMLAILSVVYPLIGCSFWRHRHDALIGLKVFLLCTKAIQALSKFYNAINSRRNYPVLLDELQAVLGELQKNPSNESILLKHMTRLNFWQKTIVYLYRVAMALALILGLVLSVVNGEFTLVLEVHIPFVDEKTFFGYIVTTACHGILVNLAAIVFPAFDSFFMILNLPIGAFIDAIGNEIGELNLLLVDDVSSNQQQIEEKIQRIYRAHQMLVDFETRVDNHYSGHNWILLTANMVGMVCSVYLAYIKRYYTAYGVLVAMIAQISQYCILGTYVAAKNQRMVEFVYTVSFYNLSIRHQRMIALMLHRAQNATEMCAGRIVPLNMETYVEVLKGMYSYITILATMMD